MRKKVDSRIRTLVENCVAQRHRSLFVIVGDKGRDQVVNLHYMLSKTTVKARPSVLWCYKKELYISRCMLVPLVRSGPGSWRELHMTAPARAALTSGCRGGGGGGGPAPKKKTGTHV